MRPGPSAHPAPCRAGSTADPQFAGECLSANPQIFRGRFASVRHFFIAHLGTLIEVAQAGSFHGRDVHKHVLAAIVGLNKSISFSCIEPLHNTCRHVSHSFGKTIVAVERRKDRWASKTHPPAKPLAPTLGIADSNVSKFRGKKTG